LGEESGEWDFCLCFLEAFYMDLDVFGGVLWRIFDFIEEYSEKSGKFRGGGAARGAKLKDFSEVTSQDVSQDFVASC
jgi:hypothetical protein